MPRAVCHSNTAAALIKAGMPGKAVVEAFDGFACCLEYTKGQHRLLQALRADGQRQAADDHELDIKRIEAILRPQMHYTPIGMVCLGWLEHDTYAQIYAPPYFAHQMSKIADLRTRDGVMVLASLVPLSYGITVAMKV